MNVGIWTVFAMDISSDFEYNLVAVFDNEDEANKLRDMITANQNDQGNESALINPYVSHFEVRSTAPEDLREVAVDRGWSEIL